MTGVLKQCAELYLRTSFFPLERRARPRRALRLFEWLLRGRERHARVLAAADDLTAEHGLMARSEAILFARMSRDGQLYEQDRDAQFWWRVVLEIDRRARQRPFGFFETDR
jgi:hypothetical protein